LLVDGQVAPQRTATRERATAARKGKRVNGVDRPAPQSARPLSLPLHEFTAASSGAFLVASREIDTDTTTSHPVKTFDYPEKRVAANNNKKSKLCNSKKLVAQHSKDNFSNPQPGTCDYRFFLALC